VLGSLLSQTKEHNKPVLSLDEKATDIDRSKKKEKQKRLLLRQKRQEKILLRTRDYVLPNIEIDGEKERRLKRLATKGVVTLFNAVAKQQSVEKNKEALGSNLQKREQRESIAKAILSVLVQEMSKASFLEMLKTESPQSVASSKNDAPRPRGKQWSVLRDDFAETMETQQDAGLV